MSDKNLFIIAGCNGAGKTTASFTILPEIIKCNEFVNADEIARGLSPFQPEKVSFEAGRIMLTRISELLSENVSFAFETTLSTRSYNNKINQAKQKGSPCCRNSLFANDCQYFIVQSSIARSFLLFFQKQKK